MLSRSLCALALIIATPAPILADPAPAASAAHDRVLPLQGGRNFRDLGGYPTGDGRHVKWGVLFRSGSMTGLTAADYASLERRGIRVVCDFRDSHERAAEPVNWPAPGAPRVLTEDYLLDYAALMPKGSMSGWTAETARATLAASYPHMLVQFNGQYRRMFAALVAGEAPLAFNCSAGKDRTGIAAALVLTALGVPRETVIEDYLLTNRTLDPAALAAGKASANSPWARLDPAVRQAFFAADRRYIEAAFAVIDAHRDGASGYLRDELGLGDDQILTLRRLYLE